MEGSRSTRIIKNTGFLYIRTVVSLVVNIFTTRILLEALGASDYGLYNVVGGSIAMLGFISASMSSTTQRFISHAEGSGNTERVKSIFNNVLLIHNLLALLSILILLIAGLFFFNGVLSIPDGKQTAAIAVYGCLMVSTVFSITVVPYEAEINAHEDLIFFSMIGIIDVVLKFAIALGVLYSNGDRLIIYAICMAVESTFVRLASQWFCRKHYSECRRPEIRKQFNRDIIKEMLSFTGWNSVMTATSMVGLFGMNLVMNHYFGVKLNAAMGIATQLSGVLMGLSMNMIKALTPSLVKAEGGNKRAEMLKISITGCKFSYLIFSFFGIPVLIYITPILTLWLKDVPDMTACFCIILLITQMLEQLTVVLYQSISAEGNIRNYSICRSVSNIVPLILSILIYCLYPLPSYWILINWLIFKGIISGFITVYYAKINIGMQIMTYLTDVLKPCFMTSLLSSLTAVFIYNILGSADIRFLIPFSLSVITSIPIYYYMALNQNEKIMTVTMFQTIISKLKIKCL